MTIIELINSYQFKKEDKFIRNKDGEIKNIIANLKMMLEASKSTEGIQYNEFTNEIILDDDAISDSYLAMLRLEISKRYKIDFSTNDILQVLKILAKEHSIHPIKDMIEQTPWDGLERAETLFIDYLGADDNKYVKAVTRKWLAGAVARIYEPGIKFEMVPVLQGKQGLGKSTLTKKLGGAYFTDTLKSLGSNKDDYQLLISNWIVELGEMSSLKTTDIETMKGFISATVDKLRLPYERITGTYKRTTVFIGTDNPGQYLKDATGNRRFFPIPLENNPTKNVFKLSDDVIQQIWAEAYEIYENGEQLFLDQETDQIAEQYRSDATEENLLLQHVDMFLDMNVSSDWNTKSTIDKKTAFEKYRMYGTEEGTNKIDRTTMDELAYVLKVNATNIKTNSNMKQIRIHMNAKDDWKYKDIRINKKVKKGYMKKR